MTTGQLVTYIWVALLACWIACDGVWQARKRRRQPKRWTAPWDAPEKNRRNP